MATALAAGVVMAVGGGLQAYGSMQQGKAQQQAANYNATVQEQQAITDQRETEQRMLRQRIANRTTQGALRAKTAGSGVVLGTGSPLQALGENAKRMELQLQDMAYESGARQQSLRTSAGLQRAQGRSARSAGNMNALATIFNTAGNVASVGL